MKKRGKKAGRKDPAPKEAWDAEEAALVAAGLLRLPVQPKSNDFLTLPAPEVSLAVLRAVIRAEREED
jgi:hypothetical protein